MNRFKSRWRCLTSILLALSGAVVPNDAIGKHISAETFLPPMVCNDLVHISLDSLCQATVTPDAVLENMFGVAADYVIKVYYKDGSEQADLNFGYSDINKIYDYKIWHIASGNSCWGKLLIEDKFPPALACENDTVRCGDPVTPFALGFPIPAWISATLDSVAPDHYLVYGWDYCGVVNLSYTDYTYNYTCDSLCLRSIVRVWKAVDSIGNTAYCSDTICVLKPTFADIIIPRNYDGFDLPPIECGTPFPTLPDGNPHPDFTGWPAPKTCNTLTASYSDLKITICGSTFKVLRRWIILDWCSGKIVELNQIIKVIDERAPEFKCPEDFTMGMQVYSCSSEGKLPKPTEVIDCNDWSYDVFTRLENPIPGLPDIISKKYISYDSNEDCFYLKGAPEGRIWIEYILTDECGNQSSCTMEVGVVDNLPPIPVCDYKTVIALGIDGKAKAYAETFDDGSVDNCGIDYFQVRRMEDGCNTGSDNFGPYVDFCCDDIGKTILVALEVVDFYGNRNTCMIEATVQDKQAPVIIPPSDITIHCEYPVDFNNLDVFGKIRLAEADRKPIIIADPYYSKTNFVAGLDGLATDNCEVRIKESYIKDIQCNSGSIKRVFEATDKQGYVTVDTQYITIINTSKFTRADIIWPDNVQINSCVNVETHPDNTGYPVYLNTNCAQVAANYDDLKLAVLDSTCYKILRKWVVIDWCQYDRNNNLGIWDTTQIIVVKSSEPPTLENCDSVTFCDQYAFYDQNSKECKGSYTLTGDGYDDCTDDPDLIWSYRLDQNNDGSFGPVQSGQTVNGVLPIGTHRLRWILTDQCNNSSTCDQVFTIKDCKKPTPYCVNGIVTVVMQTNGEITVWAKDLNIASFDNCTRPEHLKFSFSPDTNHTSITYNCDSLNKQSVVTKIVRMYVTDEHGNQDYCETSIRIQDNNHVCPGTSPGFDLSGKVFREDKVAIAGAQVSLVDRDSGTVLNQITDLSGAYAFLDLNIKNYMLKAQKSDDITNGVSTLDIVLIQRHILGIKNLTSAYKIIAADVNNSQTITAKDVSDIRKAILGVINEWPNQTPSWKFIKADHTFGNPSQPWEVPYSIKSEEVVDVLDQLNFLGIKSGDVDLSAQLNFGQIAQNRYSNELQLNIELVKLDKENYKIVFSVANSIWLDGMQLGINFKEIQHMELSAGTEGLSLAQEEYRMSENGLKLSWAPQEPILFKRGDVLFTLMVNDKANNKMPLVSRLYFIEGFASEAYVDGQKIGIQFTNRAADPSGNDLMVVDPLKPNPFTGSSTLNFTMPQSANVQLAIYDPRGLQIRTFSLNANAGRNSFVLNADELGAHGLLFYVLSSPYGTASERMIILE